MRFYGDIALNQNELQQAVMQTEYDWPANPKVGQLVFKNSVVYICIQISGGLPIWVPLTREIEMYVHVQDIASNEWIINHPLNTAYVLVQVFDGNSQMVIPNVVTINSASQITIDFGGNAAGRAVILSGSLDGAQKPTYALEFHQTTPSTSWVITHNLGYAPIARVFSGSYEIQPSSIFHNSSNQVTLSFTTPQTGVAKLV
jgi:hypothetical protein